VSDERTVLQRLEDLLGPDHPYQVQIIRTLFNAVECGDHAEIQRLFCSVEMWGGAGSVADVYFEVPQKDGLMSSLLVELVREFERRGITYERAAWTASVNENWLEQGIRQKP